MAMLDRMPRATTLYTRLMGTDPEKLAWDESGTAFIRVRKTASDRQCSTYTLTLNVD